MDVDGKCVLASKLTLNVVVGVEAVGVKKNGHYYYYVTETKRSGETSGWSWKTQYT